MVVESPQDLVGFFDQDEFAVAATYTPPGGGAEVAISVVVNESRETLQLGGRHNTVSNKRTLTVIRSTLPDPQRGGRIVVPSLGETLRVEKATSADGAIWDLDCSVGS